MIETEKTPPRDMVSNDSAYRPVTVVKDHQKEGNTSHSIETLFTDYEDIEEVYFKHTTEEDDKSDSCNSFYEPVESHL